MVRGDYSSSPRMRGTPNSNLRSVRMPGLIPTYAGNTFPAALQVPHQRVHPHVCGEHTYRPLRIAMLWGSSPRMRGTLGRINRLEAGNGLIPTYAGNTAGLPGPCQHQRAHPHVCGEHYSLSRRRNTASGSSPRMRGTHVGGEEGRDEVVAERHVDEGAQQLDKGDDPPEG